MTESPTESVDGPAVRTHTIRLELVDEPGELAAALDPIAENGGNLLSVFHERGNRTPRGHIPVEIDLSCRPDCFDDIVTALRERDVTVVQADEELYGEGVTVLLTGHLVDTDLSDTLRRIEECTAAAVEDVSLAADRGTNAPSCARLRLGARVGEREAVLEAVHQIAAEKELTVVEPLGVSR